MVLSDRFARHTVFTLDPATKVHELTSFRTEWAKGVFFPFDRSTAGWTVHESYRAASVKQVMQAA